MYASVLIMNTEVRHEQQSAAWRGPGLTKGKYHIRGLIWVPAAHKNVIVMVSCGRGVHYVFLSYLRPLSGTCGETSKSRINCCVSFLCVVKGQCYECFMIPAKDKKESNCFSL